MKMALAMLAVFATLVTIIATVLVLAAFGLGKALSLVLPFSVFEASLLSMLAMWPALWAVWRIVTSGQNDDIRDAWADEQDEDDEVGGELRRRARRRRGSGVGGAPAARDLSATDRP